MTSGKGVRGWSSLIDLLDWITSKVIRFNTWIIVVVVSVTVFAGFSMGRLEYYDDITSFFPEGKKDVELFLDVGKKFGGLDIALVGVQTDGLFTAQRLMIVRKLSRGIAQIEGVDSVVSITEMRDFEEHRSLEGESSSVIQDLIGDLDEEMDEERVEAIRKRVMSREHIVGSLVSTDGKAALLVCRLTPGTNIKHTADSIHHVADEIVEDTSGVRLYFGGAPLISSYIASGAQKDLTSLTPWVVLAVIIVVLFTLKSLPAALLSLLVIGIGLAWTMGAMALLNKPITLVSSSLPMILVALGSAYGIHILSRYYSILEARPKGADRAEIVHETMRQVGIPVVMAGLTTVVGFASFLVMDIQPMREFGLLMAMGVTITLVISLLFIPAVLSRFDLGRMRIGQQSQRIPEILRHIAQAAANRPVIVLVLFSIVMAASLAGISRISTQTSTRSYFAPESEPILADDFLVNSFGGSLFIQLYVEGDILDPLVLREMEKLEDYIANLDDVSDIQSPTMIVTMANAAMMGKRQIPETREQVEPLAFMAEDDPAVRVLVDDQWTGALVQVRIGGFDTERANEIAREIEEALDSDVSTSLARVELDRVTDPNRRKELTGMAVTDAARRMDFFLSRRGIDHVGATEIAAVIEDEWRNAKVLKSDHFRREVEDMMKLSILEDELIYMADDEQIDELTARAIATFDDRHADEQELYDVLWDFADEKEHELERLALEKRAAGEASGPTGLRKAVQTIRQGLVEIYRAQLATDVLGRVVKGEMPDRRTDAGRHVTDKTDQHLSFLFSGTAILPEDIAKADGLEAGKGKMKVAVTGYPLLYQEMNRSVLWNLNKSSAVALIIIILLMAGLFRSVRIGVISMVPSVTTLLVTFGILGATNEPLDMGISMISIIALGVAVDYAIHFLWKYGEVAHKGFEGALRDTMHTTGRAVFANVFEVMFGFAILLLASLVPIRKSGGLIAETLLLAGIGTLFLMPVFLKIAHPKVFGHPDPSPPDSPESAPGDAMEKK